MKVAGVLLQLALAVVLTTSSTAALNTNIGSMSSEADFSGSFDGPPQEQFGGSQGSASLDWMWDGSGSRFPDMWPQDGSFDWDTGSQVGDGSGSGFPCGSPFSGSGSSGSSGNSRFYGGRRHFRGDVGDDYDFSSGDGSGDGSFDPFDASGSGSNNEAPRHHRHRHGRGRMADSDSGSYALDGSVGDDDWSGFFDSSGSSDIFPPSLFDDNQLGSGSGYTHRLRGSGPDMMS